MDTTQRRYDEVKRAAALAASAKRLEESLRKLRERQTEEIRRQGW